jgi:hypothetical protein
MLKNRKIHILGATVLIVAAVLVTLSAVRPPTPAFLSVTSSNPEGLAQYQRSERSAYVENPNGLAIYQQSERVLAYPARSNEAGLAIYHQSEWMQPANWAHSSDPLFQYHQSEWFGK